MDVSLTAPQFDFVTAEEQFPAFVAGFGSGKSHAGIWRTLTRKLSYPKQNVAYYLPTYDLVARMLYPRIEEELDKLKMRHKINKNDNVIDIADHGLVIARTLDNPSRIIAYEVADSNVDELDVLATDKARDAWNKILGRNRQKKPDGALNTVGVTTTPEGFRFVYERWKKNPADGYRLIKASTMSNAANLPDGYIDSLRASYPANLLAAYLDGEFVNLTAGSVYAEFDRALNRAPLGEGIRTSEPLHIGMDFNVGRMAAVVFVLRDGDPVAVDELTGLLDTPAMIAAIKQRYVGHAIYVYPDASGGGRRSNNASESDIALLRAAKFNVLAPSANPPVKDRVLAMNHMIHSEGKRRLRVNVDNCPSFVEGLEKQAYDKNGEPDKTAGFDHVCFTADTMVETRAGAFRFDELPARGLVRGPDGQFTPYHSARKTGEKQCVRVTFADGYFIDCTTDHKFLTEDGSWVQAKDLLGRACVSSVKVSRNLTASDTIVPASISQTLARNWSAAFIARFGSRTTAQSLTDVISIISTAIDPITRSKTSSASPQAATASITRQLRQRFAAHFPLLARLAARASMPSSASSLPPPSTAPQPAKPMHEGRVALTMLTASASSAGPDSGPIAIARASVVTAVSPLGVRAVHCLTAPEFGCFKLTEHGPVASNCDAAGYFIHYKFPIRSRGIQRIQLGGI